jgi:hypothetical protein
MAHITSRPSFFHIHELEKRLDVVSVPQSCFSFLLEKTASGSVIPPALLHESVPDFNLLRVRFPTVKKTPLENLFIIAAFKNLCPEGLPLHAEKPANTVVEGTLARDESHMIAGRQMTVCLHTNFVDDTTENTDAADLSAGGTKWKGHVGAA